MLIYNQCITSHCCIDKGTDQFKRFNSNSLENLELVLITHSYYGVVVCIYWLQLPLAMMGKKHEGAHGNFYSL